MNTDTVPPLRRDRTALPAIIIGGALLALDIGLMLYALGL